MPTSELPPGLLLRGIDGSNPLGFLAAVGTLRVATCASPSSNWHLQWQVCDGTWTPTLLGNDPFSEDDLIDLLMPPLKRGTDQPALTFAENLNVSCERFRAVTERAQAAATLTDRDEADFVAAFGCESLPISGRDPTIQDTALRTMSGAGHQHFLGSMLELIQTTGPDHLRASLFLPWRYSDDRPNLRWDPVDDRRYALRWNEPSGDPVRTMRGANRLAVEALPLFPTAAGERRLQTTGFSQRRGEGVLFTWPIWNLPLNIDTVRSVLSLPELQEPRPNRDELSAMGIAEVYRSERITRDKYRNFTAATPA